MEGMIAAIIVKVLMELGIKVESVIEELAKQRASDKAEDDNAKAGADDLKKAGTDDEFEKAAHESLSHRL